MRAYLDIETDRAGNICVFGISIENNGFLQWYGDDIKPSAINQALSKVDFKTIVTFNGDVFDLPRIKQCLDIDLRTNRISRDLFKEKKKLGIKGGLKDLEKMFGIARKTEGMNGYKAMFLWEKYKHYGDLDSLNLLLEYNKEDVINLIRLEEILESLREE